MNINELQEIIQKNKIGFNLLISEKIFKIDELEVFENENPVTKPTTRGGVYFSDVKGVKVKATLSDVSVTKNISKAMLGPNKKFLDIFIEGVNENEKISLTTNLTNTIQNSSKIVMYFLLKDIKIH